jgi:hypothetical protein
LKSQLKLPHPDPVRPADWEMADAAAIQALHRGNATPEQQRRALDHIIHNIAGTYDLSFRPGGEEGARATAFAEGKRYVGLQIVTLTKLSLAAIRQAKSKTPQEQA